MDFYPQGSFQVSHQYFDSSSLVDLSHRSRRRLVQSVIMEEDGQDRGEIQDGEEETSPHFTHDYRQQRDSTSDCRLTSPTEVSLLQLRFVLIFRFFFFSCENVKSIFSCCKRRVITKQRSEPPSAALLVISFVLSSCHRPLVLD